MAASAMLIALTVLAGCMLSWPGVLSTTQRFETVPMWNAGSPSTQPKFSDCCHCNYTPKTVTLHVLNVLKPPTMDMMMRITDTYQVFLLGVMEQAANVSKDWRFSATYFDLQLGFYVDAYNFVYANYSADKSYWQILGGDMKPIPLGISNYIPLDQETIIFNLTQS